MKTIYNIIFLSFVSYFFMLFSYYLLCGIISLFEVRKRSRQHELEDYDILAGSVFTLPVSIIIPTHNERQWIADSVKSTLNLKYPEFEVIVIDDGSTDGSLELLKKEFNLRPRHLPKPTNPEEGTSNQLFRSGTHPNLSVLSKESGHKKAGALNAGLEFARYRYICVVDADTILEPDALLKVMAHVERDPERIIAAGSYFGIVNGFRIKDGIIIDRSFSFNPLIAYQNIEYLRSFIGTRSVWSRYNSTPTVAGCFAIWRRDVLLEMGGFSREHSSEDVEITFRAHEYIAKKKKDGYRIIMLPYFVGWTDGPADIRSLLTQRNRWQRCMDESMWQYRHMLFNPRYGKFGFVALPYFLFYEVLGVFFETASILLAIAGWISGALDIKLMLAFFLFIAVSYVISSLFSIFSFVRDQRAIRPSVTAYFVLLTFLEIFWYRWLVSISKVCGTVGFLRGIRHFSRYTRSPRRIYSPSQK